MNLEGIVSISGLPGLFKIVAQIKNGLIVESLIDKKRTPIYSTSKVSALEEVNVYSNADDIPLKDVFQMIFDKEKGGESISHKSSNDELKNYFGEAFADYDKDRVYVSDIKKIVSWYNLLHKEGLMAETKKEKKVAAEKDETKKPKAAAKKAAGEKPKAKPAKAKAVKASGAKGAKVQTVRKAGV